MAENVLSLSKTSIYKPLDAHEIRILNLLPKASESMLQAKLVKTSLLNPMKYAALSYCWGDLGDTESVLVDHTLTRVTINLYDALHQLRDLGIEQVWVDALCINQVDLQERGHQVQHMKHVYSKAVRTYAWLGRAVSQYTRDVLDLVRWAKWCPCDASIAGAQSEALWKLLCCDYWRRRWIIQEIVVTPNVAILWGTMELSLEHLALVTSQNQKDILWQKTIQKILELRRLYHCGKAPDLLQAIYQTRASLSKEPQDKIFALLGICDNSPQFVPAPDYTLPLETIVQGITRGLIWKTGCLDIILMHKLTGPSATLPSWTPDWFRAESLPEEVFKLSTRRPSLSNLLIPVPITSPTNVLVVQGRFLGNVANTSTSFWTSGFGNDVSQIRPGVEITANQDCPMFYYCETEFLAALTFCLTGESESPRFVSGNHDKNRRHWLGMKRFIHEVLGPPISQSSLSGMQEAEISADETYRGAFRRWVMSNGDFRLHGENLQEWLKFEPLRCCFPNDSVLERLILLALFGHLSLWGFFLFWVKIVKPKSLMPHSHLIGWVILISSILGHFLLLGIWHDMNDRETGKSQKELGRLVSSNFQQQDIASARLITTDFGPIGRTSSEVEAGDKLCFIAGCTKLVVLRETPNAGGAQYRVIGTCFLCLRPRAEPPEDPASLLLEMLCSDDYICDADDADHNSELLSKYQSEGILSDLALI